MSFLAPFKIILISLLFFSSSPHLFITTSNCQISYSISGQNQYIFNECLTSSNQSFTLWVDCRNYCCPTASSLTFSSSFIQECSTIGSSSSPSQLVLILVFCMIAVAVIITVAGCYLCRAYMAHLDLMRKEEGLPDNQKGHLTVSIKDEKWIEEENRMDLTTISVAPKIEGMNCSICLDGKTIVRLLCGHEFHEECAWLWFKKRLSCPMCRNDVDFIKIKCSGEACKRYMLLKWDDYSTLKGELGKYCVKCSISKKDQS